MECVSKEVVVAAIKDAMKRDDGNESYLAGWKQALWKLKNDVEALEPLTSDVDIAELAFRKPMEPIRVRANLTLCPTCRKQLKDGHSYCKKCGQAILRKKGDDASDERT